MVTEPGTGFSPKAGPLGARPTSSRRYENLPALVTFSFNALSFLPFIEHPFALADLDTGAAISMAEHLVESSGVLVPLSHPVLVLCPEVHLYIRQSLTMTAGAAGVR